MTTTLIATPDPARQPQTGDRVRITGAVHGHGYNIGEIVTLGKGWDEGTDHPYWEGVEGVHWCISADEFEVVELSPVEEGEQARRRRYIEEIEEGGIYGSSIRVSNPFQHATTSQLRQLAELVKEINS